MIVKNYVGATFLPVGDVIKLIFAMIVLRRIVMMMEKNYVLRVVKQRLRMIKRGSVLGEKSIEKDNQQPFEKRLDQKHQQPFEKRLDQKHQQPFDKRLDQNHQQHFKPNT
jgi:hypothetical protein